MADNSNVYPYSNVAGANTGALPSAWLAGGSAASTTSAGTIGQFTVPQTGNAEYWLPIWSGEVLNAYDQYNIFEPLVTTRQITSGTTMRFPITGTVGVKAQWKAGEELLGSTDLTTPQWFDISLDERPMASHFELDDISLMLTQWEYRSEIARQAGIALATARDKQIATMIAQGAFMPSRSPAVTIGGNFAPIGGNQDLASTSYPMPASAVFNHLGSSSSESSADQRQLAALTLLEYIERYMVRLQQINGPTEGVYVAVNPRAFHDIRSLGVARTVAESKNTQPMFGGVAEAGGLGAQFTQGMNNLSDSLVYMGATIIKTNNLLDRTVTLDHNNTASPYTAGTTAGTYINGLKNVISNPGGTVNLGATTTQPQLTRINNLGDAKYNFDWMQLRVTSGSAFNRMFPVKALIWQKDAVASLSLQGMKVDSIKDIRRNTQFTVASVMRGGGILRPELCAAICGLGTN